jgi:hypothetical protein
MIDHPQSPFLWQNDPRPSIMLQDRQVKASETARRQGNRTKNISFTTYSKAKSSAKTKAA